MIIDSHQHFWRFNPVRDAWITEQMSVLRRDFLPEDLLPELEANGVGGCVAVQADQSEEETQFLLALAARHEAILGVVGWIDLQSERVAERLESFRGFDKLRGFRHIVQAEPDDRFMLREAFLRGVRALAQFDFAYDILIYPRQLPAALELVERCPGQRFVVDHIAKPPIASRAIDDGARGLRALAAGPQVYCKLSGLVTEHDWRTWRAADFAPYLEVVFEAFGPDRLMFGSDWPVCLLAASYAQVKQLVVDHILRHAPASFDAIMGGNAERFYRLHVPRESAA